MPMKPDISAPVLGTSVPHPGVPGVDSACGWDHPLMGVGSTVGDLIQQALDELGWSQADLARRLGKSRMHISLLIRGERGGTGNARFRESLDVIGQVLGDALDAAYSAGATTFRLSTRDLYDAAGLAKDLLTPEEKRISRAYAAATPEQRARLDAIASKILGKNGKNGKSDQDPPSAERVHSANTDV